MVKNGRITKGVGGLYTVYSEGEYYRCKARGVFRNIGETPLVGVNVSIAVLDETKKEASIRIILPRKTKLTRPPAANVEQVIITACLYEPPFNQGLLDRYLVLSQDCGVDVLVVINKSEGYSEIFEPYKLAGYGMVFTDALNGFGIPELRNHMKGRLSLFAGPSGVGKSSLINALIPKLDIETGTLSKKTVRGKHTTRHTEIFPLGASSGDGFCFDTPGFSSLDFSHIKKERLAGLYKEFIPHIGKCRFANCCHIKELGCAIKEEVGKTVHPLRYESYVRIFTDVLLQ